MRLLADTASRNEPLPLSFRLVTWYTEPPRPPVAEAPKPTAPGNARTGPELGPVVRPEVGPVTELKENCIRDMSEHVSSTIGLFPAVELSLSLRHKPVATFCTRNLP